MIQYEVGQQVICVDTEWANPIKPGHDYPRKGRIYTIGYIIPLLELETQDDLGLNFLELRGAWYHWHFRPVKKIETDISVFTSLLTPVPSKELESA